MNKPTQLTEDLTPFTSVQVPEFTPAKGHSSDYILHKETEEKQVIRWKSHSALFVIQVLHMPIKTFQGQMIMFPGVNREDKHITLTLAPRGSGKSWGGTVGDSTHRVCVDPNERIQFIAESQSTAKLFLTHVKTIFEKNQKLRYYFGNHVGRQDWSKTQITSALRTRVMAEPTIGTFGAGGAIVGRHVTTQYLDDVSTLNTAATQQKREDLLNWLHVVVLPVLEPGGTLKIRGTRYFKGDLYESMLEEWGEGILFRVKALFDCPSYEWTPEKKWPHKTSTFGDACDINEKDGTVYHSYFAERMDVGFLLELRRKDPIAFESQYQNSVNLQGSGFIIKDKIKIIDSIPVDIQQLQIFMAFDLAAGTKKSNDFFSMTVIAYNPFTGFLYVLENTAVKYPDVFVMMDEMYKTWRRYTETGAVVVNMAIESNAYQKIISQSMNSPNAPQKFAILPVSEINTQKDKESRFVAQTGRINAGQIFFLKSCYRLIEDIMYFPNLPHDDRVDSFLLCLESIWKINRDFMPLSFNLYEYANTRSKTVSYLPTDPQF